MTTTERLWTIEDVSEFTRIPVGTLYYWRTKRKGPPGKRLGKYIRYKPTDVLEWWEGLSNDGGDG